MAGQSEEKRQQLMEIAAGVLIALIFFLLSYTEPYQRLELLSLDARFNLRPSIQENPDIATIDIDDRALQEEGRWQDWTRDKHARLINVLRRAGAVLIGVDIYFSEESERMIRLEDAAGATSLDEVMAGIRDYDGELAAEAEKARSVYWGAAFDFGEGERPEGSPGTGDRNYSRIPADVIGLLSRRGLCVTAENTGNMLPRAASVRSFPLPRLVDASRGVGFAQILLEADGVVRKYPTFIEYQPPDDKESSYLFPSIGLAMACDYLQTPLKNLRIEPGKYLEIPDAFLLDGSRKTLRIPINEKGDMVINWAGDYKQTFRHYPYSAIIQLGEQDSLNRIKQFLSLQNPEIFRQPGELMRIVSSSFPDIEDAATYVAYLYGAHWYEGLVEGGEGELSAATFEQLFGVSPDSAPQLYENQREVFENVRAHHRMLALVSKNENILLKEAIEKGGLEPQLAEDAFERITELRKKGGPQASDHPLFFLKPVKLEGKEISLADLRGGVFFYGLTATGTHDLNPTPFSPRYPMVGAIANVFNTIVTNQFITPLPTIWRLPIYISIGLITGFILSSRTTVRGSLFTLLFLIAYLLFAYWMFVNRRVWIEVVPAAIILISDAGIVWYKFNVAERRRRFIKRAFEFYMNPAVVDQIAKNPEMLELGGKEMELTAFFSDVASFTTISEQLTPHQLVELLNEYLTAMTDIVLSYNGLLDKYEGDAIMAVFGAPIHYSDHATRACYVALDMQAELGRLREKWKQEGKPQLHARVGINSGNMVVGNMGSKTRFDYTVMGDSVNLASRLEGVNKQYSTSIMISEFTYALCKNDVQVREIDLILVKGKAKPVSIYEVLGRSTETPAEELKTAVERYLAGLEAYRRREWTKAIEAFEQALAIRPDDGPSLTYIGRCKQYLESPPPDDWDGAYVMTTK